VAIVTVALVGPALGQGSVMDTLGQNTGRWPEGPGCRFDQGALVLSGATLLTANDITFADGTISVVARRLEGPPSAGFGLLFRAGGTGTASEGYVLLANGEGQWQLQRLGGGKLIEIAPWRSFGLPAGEGSADITLAVTCEGPRIAVSLNGQQAAALEDGTLVAGGVGLVSAAKGLSVAFRDLTVTPRRRSAAAAADKPPMSAGAARQIGEAELLKLRELDGLKTKVQLYRFLVKLTADEVKRLREDIADRAHEAGIAADAAEANAARAGAGADAASTISEGIGALDNTGLLSNATGMASQFAGLFALEDAQEGQEQVNLVAEEIYQIGKRARSGAEQLKAYEDELASAQDRLRAAAAELHFTTAPRSEEWVVSHLGRWGRAFGEGTRPSTLGWGPDDRPYPDRFIVNWRDGAEMCWVPPGSFMMGAPASLGADMPRATSASAGAGQPDPFADARPSHRVRIAEGFWMYRHEVTNAQFRRFRADFATPALRADSPTETLQRLALDSYSRPAGDLSHADAESYAAWAGGGLPTEAEWEYACRAGEAGLFWWGNASCDTGRFANTADPSISAIWPNRTVTDTDDGFAGSAEVGAFAPNGLGLFDMAGNVAEWCKDRYAAGYYAQAPGDDPPGPAAGPDCVLRGGSWFRPIDRCGSAVRSHAPGDPDSKGSRDWDRGVRLCVYP
jgi:formylglycine-generating enzyme required for sulfatase activity